MTAPAPSRSGSPGLLGRLMAEVRSEFRRDILEFGPEDPVFGGAACRVAECRRTARGRGLCPGHLLRWADQGRPDMEQFVASTDPRWRRQRPNQRCRVSGCGYGSTRGGLCALHAQRWQRAGRYEMQVWLVDCEPVLLPVASTTCGIQHCQLWPHATSPFCHTHTNTWKANGRPDVDEFADRFAEITPASEVIRLDWLAPQLKLEMQYVLQRRHDDRQGKLTPDVVMRLVRALAELKVNSLTDYDEDVWSGRIRLVLNDKSARSLFGYAYRTITDLADADGWEAEYPRDVWRMRRLGYDGDRRLQFDGIGQPWLRELAKRWVRWRLSAGLGLEAGGARPVVVITRFAGFLADIGIDRIEQVDRPVLERYLAHLRADPAFTSAQRRGNHIGLLNRFFTAIRQHRWDTGLPASAMFFTEDYPKRAERLPRAVTEHIMAQLEHPDNLARFADPSHRLITIILMRCGLRITDALRLRADCIIADDEGAPYLRYYNH